MIISAFLITFAAILIAGLSAGAIAAFASSERVANAAERFLETLSIVSVCLVALLATLPLFLSALN